ncbi:MAG TPA: bifunctional phosphopantothenoylcysteine decarboxylase/phosphopantothenate--cysteine ligase CoaBC [Anaerolineae bacterium]|nr:bifunctional phosphopantothenoylcysteine decarboxylase/phosphopantothenate--cysteine ligase CoaBC [Anaerolineae bacterium]HCM97261.1 bifunctional phosphopantothenoylcysteine decarboxylase/phosphopantothenate--cysteine ligase CoaBC [Anaerolineae bacterium]
MTLLKDKHILLGVCGSIAAYKAADLASKLTQAGALVDVIITPAAEKFITPLTFQSVTGRKAYTEADLWGGQAHILHVGLSHATDLLVVAPCTANTLAKMAHGLADNLLTITALAARCPILIAPAMDVGMYTHTATQENVRILTSRGVTFAGPDEGRMASGLIGKGRMLEPADLFGHIRLILGKTGRLAGKHITISAGGTQEPIDPVRFISNRSSGKQGYALAQAALDAGAQVTLVSAPTGLVPPVGASFIPVNTAREMLASVLAASHNSHALLMAAAVADFSPKNTSDQKIKKRDGIPTIELEAAPDILGILSTPGYTQPKPKVIVGFAAESRDLLENAAEKLRTKKMDLIVANDISASDAGFGVDTNRVTLLHADGSSEDLPLLSKVEVSETIIERLATLLENN